MDAVWLTPFYPSPLVDGGYDITDHRNVDRRLGTMADFDDLVTTAPAHDIKIIIDIVPNHTSDQHPWFLEAAASPPGSPARNRYIFRPGDAEHPPSDWFGEFSVERQQTQPHSTLRLYRALRANRKALQTTDSTVTWQNVDNRNLLHYRRANGWECVVNFSDLPQPLPPGETIISSQPVTNRALPPNATAWLQTDECPGQRREKQNS